MGKRELGASVGILILRVSFGLFMLLGHGLPKLSSYAEKVGGFPDPLGIGSKFSLLATLGAEVGCAVLLVLGLGTRLGALGLAFTMLIACFVVHESDPWKIRELAAVYFTVYSVIFMTGAGRFSLDHFFWGKGREEVDLD